MIYIIHLCCIRFDVKLASDTINASEIFTEVMCQVKCSVIFPKKIIAPCWSIEEFQLQLVHLLYTDNGSGSTFGSIRRSNYTVFFFSHLCLNKLLSVLPQWNKIGETLKFVHGMPNCLLPFLLDSFFPSFHLQWGERRKRGCSEKFYFPNNNKVRDELGDA